MKKLLTISVCLLSCSLLAQSNESSKNITNYTTLSFYSQLQNPLPKEYVYIDHFNQFIDVPEEPNLWMFREVDMMNSTDPTGQWMGTINTSSFQFLNTRFESTQVYDINGVLRQSSISFPLKKQRVTYVPAH